MKSCSLFRRIGLSALFIAALAGLLIAPAGWSATTWYVSPAGLDANAGTSWATAKLTIQAAVNAAANNDTVLVTNGVYHLSSTISVTKALTLISANGSGVTTIDGLQTVRCVKIDGVAATLDGFTVRRGLAITGGGIYCNGGTVQNCVLTNNLAIGSDVYDAQGGGAYVAYGVISNCIICGNTARATNDYQAAWAGGIYCYGSTAINCIISNNVCTSTDTVNGAGVTLVGGTLKNSKVLANAGTAVSYASGGGVYATILQLSVPSLIDMCTVSSNSTYTSDNYIYTAAASSGGGLYIGNNTDVRNTLVNGNTCSSFYGFCSGGGIRTSGSIVENCTVVYNRATTQNSNPGNGGGVLWGYNDACTNNIVRFNTADNSTDNGEVNSLSYPVFVNSDMGATIPSNGNLNGITSNPLFVNAATDDFHLQSSSPCINTGLNLDWMTGALDLGGNSRISGTAADMGAYEYTVISQPSLSSYTRPSASQFQFQVSVTSGQPYKVQYSSSLSNWVTLFVTNASGSSFQITDTNATNGLRLYRVIH